MLFYKIQLSTNYEKIILQFALLFIALARPGTILPVVSEKTGLKVTKTYNFRIKLGMSIGSRNWLYNCLC
jgi:hypothetical protein